MNFEKGHAQMSWCDRYCDLSLRDLDCLSSCGSTLSALCSISTLINCTAITLHYC